MQCRPIKTWQQRRADRLQRVEHAELLRREAAQAAAEQALLQPVAKRRALAEASGEGLVILEAAYGVLHEYRLDRAAVEQTTATAAAMSAQQQGSFQAGSCKLLQQQQQQQQQ